MAHFVCVRVCVCMLHCSCEVLPELHSVSPLSLISLQLSVRKQREGTDKCLQRTMSESDGGTWT